MSNLINKETGELLDILNSVEDKENLQDYINDTLENSNINLKIFFNEILFENNIESIPELMEKAQIEVHYGYQILSGTRKPSRDKVIQICIAAKLNLSKTQRALNMAKLGQLYPKDSRDAIIIFGINKGFNLIQINNILHDTDNRILGSV